MLPFLRYACRGFVDGLREKIRLVREQKWQVMWEHLVHETFRGNHSSETIKRQRDVVLALGLRREGWKDVSSLDILIRRWPSGLYPQNETDLASGCDAISKTG